MRLSGARALAWSRYGCFTEAEWEHLPLETRVENVNLAWSQLRVLRRLGFKLVKVPPPTVDPNAAPFGRRRKAG